MTAPAVHECAVMKDSLTDRVLGAPLGYAHVVTHSGVDIPQATQIRRHGTTGKAWRTTTERSGEALERLHPDACRAIMKGGTAPWGKPVMINRWRQPPERIIFRIGRCLDGSCVAVFGLRRVQGRAWDGTLGFLPPRRGGNRSSG